MASRKNPFFACSLKSVCNADTRLRKAQAANYIEQILENRARRDTIRKLMENFRSEDIEAWSVADFKSAVDELAADSIKDMSCDLALDMLGVNLPSIYEIVSETTEWFKAVLEIGEPKRRTVLYDYIQKICLF